MSGKKILITGGAGFIGSTVVRRIIKQGNDSVVNVDKLTYAANLRNVESIADNPRYAFVEADICDAAAMKSVFATHLPDMVMHLAAESHVDRSIDGPVEFINTNILGTYQILQASLDYFQTLKGDGKDTFRFHHVSTDEVFGSLDKEDLPFNPDTPYNPRSPYSASKAAADHFVQAWHHTYDLPIVLSNCSNNYGPYQFPEKLIPLIIIRALAGQPLPVYGTGENVRDWLHVDDHASALLAILKAGENGASYLVGGCAERTNIEVVRTICAILDKRFPDNPHVPHADLITFVEDRPGHDVRYANDASRIRRDLGWRPEVGFEEGLRKTVEWYLDNEDWWTPLLGESYYGERIGLGRKEDDDA